LGTSRVDRSPASPAWGLVTAFYARPMEDPERVLVDLLNAGSHYESGLGDPSVLARLEAALSSARSAYVDTSAAEAARDAMSDALERALARGAMTFYGDLADRALHTTVLDFVIRHPQASPTGVVQRFLSELLGAATDHLVSRDLTAVLGVEATRQVDDLERVRRRLVESARELGRDPSLASDIAAVAQAPAQRWGPLVSRAWARGRTRRPDATG
jgi:hypothetical protein